MLTRIDHVGLAVTDVDTAAQAYADAFDLQVTHREDNEAQGVRELMLRVRDGQGAGPDGASSVQLLQPLHPDSPVGRFLERRGPGLHHVAYGVVDVDSALASLRGRGVRLVNEEPVHGTAGSRIAFVHPAGLHGVLTELVQTP